MCHIFKVNLRNSTMTKKTHKSDSHYNPLVLLQNLRSYHCQPYLQSHEAKFLVCFFSRWNPNTAFYTQRSNSLRQKEKLVIGWPANLWPINSVQKIRIVLLMKANDQSLILPKEFMYLWTYSIFVFMDFFGTFLQMMVNMEL